MLEIALKQFSTHDVHIIYDELKALSFKVDVLKEKEELSNKLAAEIKEIKDTLGIE